MTNASDVNGIILSILAHDPVTNETGIAVAATAIAIGNRCPHIVPGKAVLATQGYTNLKMGALATDLLGCGLSSVEVLSALRRHDRWMDYRQLAIVTTSGEVEVHTGKMNARWAGHLTSEGVACLGNGLPDATSLEAMHECYRRGGAPSFADRLLSAFECARSVLGLSHILNSSALLVRSSDDVQINLRVDLASPISSAPGCAIAELRALFERYQPLATVYEQRSVAPAKS